MIEENHEDCDHDLGICAVYPGLVVRCRHKQIRASCRGCQNQYIDDEAILAELEESAEKGLDQSERRP